MYLQDVTREEVSLLMLDNLCKELSSNGFPLDLFFEDEKNFGNIIIKTHLNFGPISIVRDRGIWDCSVSFRKKEIPLVALVYLLDEKSFEFDELVFDSVESLSTKQLLEAKKKWDILTKSRLKK